MPDSLLHNLSSLLATPDPAELGPGPRAGVLTEQLLEGSLKELLAGPALAPVAGDCVRALVLLWHDHLDAAHLIAQGVANRDGSFVHGIVHRREPDYGNAKYWFGRVGEHPCFPAMSRRVTALLEAIGQVELQRKLLPRGQWEPFAFIDACEQAARKPAPAAQQDLLRGIQRIETDTLMEHLLAAG